MKHWSRKKKLLLWQEFFVQEVNRAEYSSRKIVIYNTTFRQKGNDYE